jgi:hypothetical protein
MRFRETAASDVISHSYKSLQILETIAHLVSLAIFKHALTMKDVLTTGEKLLR